MARFAPPTARVARHAAGPAGQLAVGLGHERRAALVTRRHDPDAGVTEGVEQAEERLAGHGEGVADAGGAQRVGDEPTHGPGTDGGLDFGRGGVLGRIGVLGHGRVVRRGSILGRGGVVGRLGGQGRVRPVRGHTLGLGFGLDRGRVAVLARGRVRVADRVGIESGLRSPAVHAVKGVLDRRYRARSGVKLGHGDGIVLGWSALRPISTPTGRRRPTGSA